MIDNYFEDFATREEYKEYIQAREEYEDIFKELDQCQ